MFFCSLRACRLHLYLFSLSVIVSSPSSLLKLILNLAESCDHPPDAPNSVPATAKLCQSAEMSLHFLILPLNPPIIYLILNQGMVWYRFSILLHAFYPLT